MRKLVVDIYLDCGHTIMHEIEAVILRPEIGDAFDCPKCKKDCQVTKTINFHRSIVEVGVAYWFDDDEPFEQHIHHVDPLQSSFFDDPKEADNGKRETKK